MSYWPESNSSSAIESLCCDKSFLQEKPYRCCWRLFSQLNFCGNVGATMHSEPGKNRSSRLALLPTSDFRIAIPIDYSRGEPRQNVLGESRSS